MIRPAWPAKAPAISPVLRIRAVVIRAKMSDGFISKPNMVDGELLSIWHNTSPELMFREEQ